MNSALIVNIICNVFVLFLPLIFLLSAFGPLLRKGTIVYDNLYICEQGDHAMIYKTKPGKYSNGLCDKCDQKIFHSRGYFNCSIHKLDFHMDCAHKHLKKNTQV